MHSLEMHYGSVASLHVVNRAEIMQPYDLSDSPVCSGHVIRICTSEPTALAI